MRWCFRPFASVLTAALCSCSLTDESSIEPGQQITSENIEQICGREWRLADWRIVDEPVGLAPDSRISFRCDSTLRVSGIATINGYFAQLAIDESGQVSWPGPGFGSTMKAGPTELMDQEQRYLKALGSIKHMAMQHGQLILTGNERETRLEFAPIVSIQAKALIGMWLRPVRNTPPQIDTLEGLQFLPEGIVHLIGIFSMNGLTWRLDGDRLTIATNTERYPEPFPLSYVITTLNDESLVMAGQGYLAGTYSRASTVSTQPLPASRAAAIDANLKAYDRISGELVMGDAAATFEAYFYGDTLRYIHERVDQGDYGITENRYYLGAEGLFYFRSERDLVATSPERSGKRDHILLTIAYDGEGKVTQAFKVVNGKVASPREQELVGPKHRLTALRDRIDALSGGTS